MCITIAILPELYICGTVVNSIVIMKVLILLGEKKITAEEQRENCLTAFFQDNLGKSVLVSRINHSEFLPCDTMLAPYSLSSCVCLSICLSVTCQYCIHTARHKITQTPPPDSSGL